MRKIFTPQCECDAQHKPMPQTINHSREDSNSESLDIEFILRCVKCNTPYAEKSVSIDSRSGSFRDMISDSN